MNNYILAALPVTMVDFLWNQIEPHLVKVVELAHNEITLESTKKKIKNGDTLLIMVLKDQDIIAVNTLEVRNFESGLKCQYIPCVGGEDFDGWVHQFFEYCKMIAKEFNCTEIRGCAVRKGWLRKLSQLGYEWTDLSTIIKYEV